mmetsp:Transcript_10138/g.61709  ORF Transcript_10138/g.61709 Transcript_10138/m.61709 type:complete len:82 (-) Transcript_10138:91-336(-)
MVESGFSVPPPPRTIGVQLQRAWKKHPAAWVFHRCLAKAGCEAQVASAIRFFEESGQWLAFFLSKRDFLGSFATTGILWSA